MSKRGLLLCSKNSERLLEPALAERFELIRAWEFSDLKDTLDARGEEVVAILTTSLDLSLLDSLPNLQLIVVPAAGYENIDVATARTRGVTIANAGDTHSNAVADHALALLLASVHRLPEMQDWVREGRWAMGESPERRHEMSAQRFGFVGLGNIGTAIAKRLAPFNGEIAWWSPHAKEAAWPRKNSLLDLAQWSTALIIAARGDAVGLIDAETIRAVGPHGLIVNISRGAVIDEDAMIVALKTGKLGGAALDVFEEEPALPDRWRDVPNVILTPHVGGASQEAQAQLRHVSSRNLATILDGDEVVNEIKR